MRSIMTACLVAGCTLTSAPWSKADDTPTGPVRWEYRVVRGDELVPSVPAGERLSRSKEGLAAALNRLGKDGWELVAVEPGGLGWRDIYRLPESITWDRFSRGGRGSTDTVDFNDSRIAHFKEIWTSANLPVPADGKITKAMFDTNLEAFRVKEREWLAEYPKKPVAPTNASTMYYLKRLGR